MWSSFPHERAWTRGGIIDTVQVRGNKISIFPRGCGDGRGSGGGGGGFTNTFHFYNDNNLHLQQHQSIDELEVSCLYISSKLSDQMMALIEQKRIPKLVLRSCQVHPKVLERLLSMEMSTIVSSDGSYQNCNKSLYHSIDTRRSFITHLEIHKSSKLDCKCMEAISRLSNLESLTLNINPHHLESLFPHLSALESLQTLNLSGCLLERNKPCVVALAHYLSASSTSHHSCHEEAAPSSLRQLSLKCCRLSDLSVERLVHSMMRRLPNLEKLDLVGNSSCHLGLDALGCLLSSPWITKLTILDVSYQNEDLGDVSKFANALQGNMTLKALRIAGNSLGNNNVKILANALAKNTSLNELDLSANCVGDKGLEALIQAMEQNQALTTLSLKYNVFADLSCLESVLRTHNYSLQQLNHSCQVRPTNIAGGELLADSTAATAGGGGERISYYLRLNQGGRILLKKNENSTPLGLWPIVLERSFPSENFDAIFFILRHSSMLFAAATAAIT
jgi:hypothetical protein